MTTSTWIQRRQASSHVPLAKTLNPNTQNPEPSTHNLEKPAAPKSSEIGFVSGSLTFEGSSTSTALKE